MANFLLMRYISDCHDIPVSPLLPQSRTLSWSTVSSPQTSGERSTASPDTTFLPSQASQGGHLELHRIDEDEEDLDVVSEEKIQPATEDEQSKVYFWTLFCGIFFCNLNFS